MSRVPSPCIKVCQIDNARGVCIGCLRTLQEIADWLEMSPKQQLATLQRVAERRRQESNPESASTGR
ncbi:MAG: DUF1289 domain-containing protein [Betaproteobacteria bacterium]|nr:DUF1289 domain-containing protein [Betaproteobacteria bacterium]